MSVKDNLITFIKGFILGTANIIPGVSGGTIAVSLGLYEMIIEAISNFFKDVKKNFAILLPIIIGVGVALITTSKLIIYALANFKNQTIFLFVGLIAGGITLIMRKTRKKETTINIAIFLLMFGIVLSLGFLKTGNIIISFVNMNFFDYLLLFLVGVVASATMIIPGISGSFVLMLLGYYDKIISIIANLTNFSKLGTNLLILIPFGLGVILGIILMTKLINILLQKYEIKMYFAIMGFVLSSIVVLLLQITKFTYSFSSVITCLIAFCWGYALSRAMDKE